MRLDICAVCACVRMSFASNLVTHMKQSHIPTQSTTMATGTAAAAVAVAAAEAAVRAVPKDEWSQFAAMRVRTAAMLRARLPESATSNTVQAAQREGDIWIQHLRHNTVRGCVVPNSAVYARCAQLALGALRSASAAPATATATAVVQVQPLDDTTLLRLKQSTNVDDCLDKQEAERARQHRTCPICKLQTVEQRTQQRRRADELSTAMDYCSNCRVVLRAVS